MLIISSESSLLELRSAWDVNYSKALDQLPTFIDEGTLHTLLSSIKSSYRLQMQRVNILTIIIGII